jgi:hypothetical protein
MYLRDVVEKKHFSADFDQLRELHPQLEATHEWLTWALANNPRLGKLLEVAPDFRAVMTPALEDTPSFWVLYTFDADKVYLHSIAPARGLTNE